MGGNPQRISFFGARSLFHNLLRPLPPHPYPRGHRKKLLRRPPAALRGRGGHLARSPLGPTAGPWPS
jgi:hypothetical protein